MTCLDRGWAAAVLRCAVAVLFGVQAMAVQAADLAYERALENALASPFLPIEMVRNANDACETVLCFGEALVNALPDNVRLEPVTHPDTDSIRRVDTAPSVHTRRSHGILQLQLTHFGRKAVAELRQVLGGIEGHPRIELDLDGNPGGDFERMLDIAGLLIGPSQDAVKIDHGDHIERRSLRGPHTRPWRVTHVRIDEKTASAALLLARLFEVRAGAEILGPRPNDKPVFLKRRITIAHDWRLILPMAEVSVLAPG